MLLGASPRDEIAACRKSNVGSRAGGTGTGDAWCKEHGSLHPPRTSNYESKRESLD